MPAPRSNLLSLKTRQRYPKKRTNAAGIINCGQTIIKEEGVRSLWKGLTPFATHLTLKYALRMGTNATYQSLLRDEVSALFLYGVFSKALEVEKCCSSMYRRGGRGMILINRSVQVCAWTVSSHIVVCTLIYKMR
jgi:hypothetical protein